MVASIGAVLTPLLGAGRLFGEASQDEIATHARLAAHDVLGVVEHSSNPR
jgi:hypothetical protein